MREVKLCQLFVLLYTIFIYNASSETTHGYEVIPERAEVLYTNEKYVVNTTVNVRRYNRKGSYVVNFWGYNKDTWANNITIDVIFHEFLHNEYKRSFVELHYKLCDLIEKDQFLGPVIRARGLTCPIPAGLNGVMNATLIFPKFPYVFPFQRCKTEIIVTTTSSHDLIGRGFVYMTIKEIRSKPQ